MCPRCETLEGDELSQDVDDELLTRAQIKSADFACEFVMAGNAHVTLKSQRTGARFTYRVKASEDKRVLFVKLLTGPDNNTNYQYLGTIRVFNRAFTHGSKSRISAEAPSAKAFAWAWRALAAGRYPDELEVWHEGRCGRCGRRLTVPESIASGFGPECIQHVQGARHGETQDA